MIETILYSIFSYAAGCLCFGYYLVNHYTGINLKNRGSGSLGATNASRVMGWKGFVVTFLLDFLKGFFVVRLALLLGFGESELFLFCLLVVAGHIWPVQLGFRGGKGVSAFAGGMLAISWELALPVIPLFLLVFLILRKFSISGLLAFLVVPVYMVFRQYPAWSVVLTILQLIIIFVAHRQNLAEFVTFRRSNQPN